MAAVVDALPDEAVPSESLDLDEPEQADTDATVAGLWELVAGADTSPDKFAFMAFVYLYVLATAVQVILGRQEVNVVTGVIGVGAHQVAWFMAQRAGQLWDRLQR